MTSIIYYADKDIEYYNKKTHEKLNKYHVKAGRKNLELKTTISEMYDSLIHLGLLVEDYYKKNSSKINLINCTPELKDKGFRPLTKHEETMLWLGMNVQLKEENSEKL